MTTAEGEVAAARELATRAHEGQKRWGGEPYITHPEAVAAKVRHLGPEYECAAWLHDVLEDTDVEVDALLAEVLAGRLPESAVTAVVVLTHPPQIPYLVYVLAVGRNPIARAVKLADLEHNIVSALAHRGRSTTITDKWQLAKYILENTERPR